MRLASLLLAIALPIMAQAQPLDDGPKSPEESLKCIKVRPGFVVELMAHEPVVQDPIAFAWGPDGKFWVVEMGDYPLGTPDKKGGGRIKILEKSKAEGPYDKATIFIEGLSFPTGVTPWKKGVLVTCAPDIFYAEDTNGDGKADKKEVLFTGFVEGNQQHRVNGLVYGLDGWYYGANGDSGGVVTSVKTGKKVDIRGRDFRLKPDTGEFETATGQTQFGRCRDDFGNWFGCNNSNPLYHYVLEEHYMSRNPYLIPPSPRINVSETPGASRVYPISKPQPRFNTPAGLNHFTSACSAIIYRDDFFGPEFYGNSFVAEPVHNLIHREVMDRKGITFTSRRAADEKESEFLASSDNWFRPTTIAVGPDGCLWIADMYRQVIEHPEWIPKDWQKKVDLRAGHDKGRIYRVRPTDKTPPAVEAIPTEDRAIVKLLASSSSWSRDYAVQLLQKDHVDGEVWKVLIDNTTKGKPATVVASLKCITQYSMLEKTAGKLLSNFHPEIRRWAVRLQAEWHGIDDVNELISFLDDKDSIVRFQTAQSWGVSKALARDLKSLALATKRHSNDDYFVAAALSSLQSDSMTKQFVLEYLKNGGDFPPSITRVASRTDPSLVVLIVNHRLANKSIADDEAMSTLVATFGAMDKRPHHPAEWVKATFGKDYPELEPRMQAFADLARRHLANQSTSPSKQMSAISFLGLFGKTAEDARLLSSFLEPGQPDDIQAAAANALSLSAEPSSAIFALRKWKQLSPRSRASVLDFTLAMPASTRILLDQLESKQIAAAEIDSIRRTKLTDHPEPAIRERARKVFGAASDADRAKVVNDYWVHQFKKGDATAGKKLFAKHCAVCHKFEGQGQDVGPDLASVKDRSAEALLVAILDPNRAVEARYLNYVAVTKSGKTLTGILAQETGNSISLVAADGKKHDVLRTDLEALASTGKSLMPEGLEKELPPRDFVDLIEYLKK